MSYNAVLVPGGGQDRRGEVHPWVAARLDYALQIRGDAPIVCLSAGTPYHPGHASRTEARAGAAWLLARGLPCEAILLEECSLDTIGNAWFSRLLHAAPRGWRRLLVVTSAFHHARCEAVFQWIYSLPGPDGPYQVDCRAVPDTGLEPSALQARAGKEAAALERVRALAARLTTPAAVHHWLYTEHAAYAAGLAPPPVDDPALLGSY